MIDRRQTKKGVRYEVRVRDADGREVSRSFTTLKEAERFQRHQLTARDRGEWIDPRSGRLTLGDWAERWLMLPGRRVSTTNDYRDVMNRDVLPVLGGRALASITPTEVQALVNAWSARISPASVGHHYRTLRACLNAAVASDLIGRSPCRGVKLPNVERLRSLPSPDVVMSLASEVGDGWRCAVVLGALGLRRGEVLGLKVSDLNVVARRLSIVRQVVETGGRMVVGPPKTTAGIRSIQLPISVVGELAAHLARRGWTAADGERWLFGDGDEPVWPSNFSNAVWGPARRRLGLGSVRFHDLRHLAATTMVSAGIDPKTVQHRLGHASLHVTLGLYAQATADADRRAAETLDEVMFGGGDQGRADAR